jgi:hypothetical protein
MKKTLIITIATLMLATVTTTIAGPLGFHTRVQEEESIQLIRQHYATINRSAAKYRKVRKELSGFSAEGGQLIAYFNGQNLMKIGATFYGESGRASEEYYYWDGKLIFVLRTDFAYNKPLSGKVVRTELSRFYFNDDRLIRWVDAGGKQVGAGASEFGEKQKDYLDSSIQFAEGARSNKTTIESND